MDLETIALDPEQDAMRILLLDNLLSRRREGVEMAYLQALARYATAAAVLVLDLRDPDARAIAEAAGHREQIAKHVAEAPVGRMPVMTRGLPRRLARDLVDARFPGVGAMIDSVDPRDGFPAVVVGLATAAVTPVLLPPESPGW